MKNLFSDNEMELAILFHYKFINEEIKKCKEYDGFSAENQLQYYIEINGFNPHILINEIEEKILSYYLPKIKNLDILNYFKKDEVILAEIQPVEFALEKEFELYPNKIQIIDVLFFILFRRIKKRLIK